MANPMENGPSHCNGEAEQVWERPWTLEEMRKNSANWSLAADSGLFLYMQDFSQWMLSKTHEIEKQLDGLIRDTKATDSCLHTVFNDFLMLSNIQFIENRVYDEEVEEAVPKTDAQERRPEQERTREQKEAELIPKVQEAMNYGLKVLESAFEQLDVKVGNSDSEDEEAADRVEPILEPKDLYVDRPLPYLIGSQAFMEQDDVGLGDLSSDEMSIDSDRESFIESEADKDQEKQHSDEDSDQAEESQGSLKKKLVSSDEDEDDEDSDLFGESDKDEDEAKRDDVDPTSFAHQLAARIKDTTKKPEADRTSLSSGTSVTKRKKQGKKPPEAQVEDDEMFKPPEMEDDEYSPFGEKGGLFSGGKGLFDDDGEEYLFSEAPKMQKEQTDVKKTEIVSAKKIPTGAVSIFPGNNLFGSPNGSDSLESKENDRPVKSKMQAAREQTSLGSGLFDDNDDDDFFTGKAVKKSAVQEKPKPKVTADLFGGDDNEEDGDIFSVGSRSAVSQESKKFGEEEEVVQQPEKKLPAGAISMFGPGTNSLLAESLKKRHPSASEDSVKSVESVPPAEVKPSAASKATKKAQSLFSDDEDSQIFPTVPKSHSKPEGKVQNKPSKTAVSLFADDEEEDLFSSVPKSQSVPGKTAVSQTRKSLSSGLFSDDEDQWLNSQPSSAKPGVKSGGMKASTSAPSRLPSAKAPQKDSLFDVDDDDDLFAATKESRQKNSQRVSLLFEDEDDEDKGSLFGFKPSANKGTPEVKVPIAASQTPPLFGSEETQEVVAEEKKAVQPAPPPEGSNKIKKPAGAVSLFGGISVLGDEAKNKTKQSKNTLDDLDELDWHTEAPPPMETKEKKSTKNTFSLFDDDDEEEEPDETPPLSIANKNTDKSTIKSQEPKASVKSTGVFQDEELLFSQTQQKDNDPEVDLFAASSKPSKPVPSLVKPAGSTLFGEEEDDDDLFSTSKQKVPPKVPDKPSKAKHEETDKGSSTVQSIKSEKPVSPVTSKETSSRIGKLQASLAINPASLMPGAGPRVPSALSINSDLAPSSSPRPAGLLPASAATAGLQVAAGGGIGFDTPAQVTTLQNANKVRIKGAMQRRPQSRAARHLAAQQSEEGRLDSPEENSSYQAGSSARTTSASSAFNPIPARPSALTLPISTNNTTMPAQTVSDGVVRPKILPAAEEDLFSSVDIFSSASVPKHTPSPQTKTKAPETVFHGAFKKKEPALPIFSDNSDDLFATVKPKTVKKAKAMPFLDADDDDDIFGKEKKKDSKSLASSTIPDIFQDDKETSSKVFTKPKEQSLEASLFNDDVDIFADLTPTTKPKEKKPKKKVETKSIFDDDMDDIFSSGFTKPVGTSTAKKSKKPVQEPNSAEESGHNIFDDPLNVFGGK